MRATWTESSGPSSPTRTPVLSRGLSPWPSWPCRPIPRRSKLSCACCACTGEWGQRLPRLSSTLTMPAYCVTSSVSSRLHWNPFESGLAVLPVSPSTQLAGRLRDASAKLPGSGAPHAVTTGGAHLTIDPTEAPAVPAPGGPNQSAASTGVALGHDGQGPRPVSYTHLTLPTNREV